MKLTKTAWKIFYLYACFMTRIGRILHKKIHRVSIRKILVIRLHGIGNMVLAMPALTALRRGYPKAEITVMVSDVLAWEICSISDLADGMVYYKYGDELDFSFLNKIWSADFDLVVFLYPMEVVDLPLLMSASRIRYRVGYKNRVKGNLYTHFIDAQGRRSEADLNLDIACLAGGKRSNDMESLHPVETGGKEIIDRLMASGGKKIDFIIIIHPGSKPFKRWPIERFAQLCDRFIEDLGANVIIVGGSEEIELGRDIASLMVKKPICAAGKLSLLQTVEIVGRSRLFVGNDSGLMHIAAAIGTPTVVIFGPTDPIKNRPLGNPDIVQILTSRLACSPCYRDGEVSCIYDEYRCLEDILVDSVFSQAARLLELQAKEKKTPIRCAGKDFNHRSRPC